MVVEKNFYYTFKDYIYFQFQIYSKLKWWLVFMFFSVVLNTVLSIKNNHFDFFSSSLFIFLCFIVFFILMVLFYTHRKLKNESAKKGICLKFLNDKMEYKSIYCEGSIVWGGIKKAVETKSHIFLFVSNYVAYLLPKNQMNAEEISIVKKILAENHLFS